MKLTTHLSTPWGWKTELALLTQYTCVLPFRWLDYQRVNRRHLQQWCTSFTVVRLDDKCCSIRSHERSNPGTRKVGCFLVLGSISSCERIQQRFVIGADVLYNGWIATLWDEFYTWFKLIIATRRRLWIELSWSAWYFGWLLRMRENR